jgi:hypothetical protein
MRLMRGGRLRFEAGRDLFSNPKDNMTMTDQTDDDPGTASGRKQRIVVADTITGANLRVRDNVFQAVVIAICLVLGAVGGWLYEPGHAGGLIVGALLGTVLGLIGSGAVLAVYRLFRH